MKLSDMSRETEGEKHEDKMFLLKSYSDVTRSLMHYFSIKVLVDVIEWLITAPSFTSLTSASEKYKYFLSRPSQRRKSNYFFSSVFGPLPKPRPTLAAPTSATRDQNKHATCKIWVHTFWLHNRFHLAGSVQLWHLAGLRGSYFYYGEDLNNWLTQVSQLN